MVSFGVEADPIRKYHRVVFGNVASNWYIGEVSNWNVSSVTRMSYMFQYTGQNATTWSIGDLSNWNVSNVTNMGSMFQYAGRYLINDFVLNLSNWDTSSVTNMSGMFSGAGMQATKWGIGDLSGWDTSKVTDMNSMFYEAGRNATEWSSIGNLNNWNVSNVTDMSKMFREFAGKIPYFNLDLSGWDTSNVTNMSYMFYEFGGIAPVLNLNGWDTSNVTNMSNMFKSVRVTSFDLSSWDTSNVTYMSAMFNGCSYVTEAYARTQADADRLNASSSKPTTWQFVSVAPIVELTINNQSSDLVSVNLPSTIEGGITEIKLISIKGMVGSFKMNGTLIEGNAFIAPAEGGNVTISDVVLTYETVIESRHNPYETSASGTYETATFVGASSLTIELEYQMAQSNSYDYLYIYDSAGTAYGKYGGTTKTVTSINIPGDTARFDFTTNSSSNNSYGFKAKITAHYPVELTINNQSSDLVTIDVPETVYGGLTKINLVPTRGIVTSFKLNGELVEGNSFIAPYDSGTVTISDVVVGDQIVIESEHNPYPGSMNSTNADGTQGKIYGEATFEGATSLTVLLDYQTESTSYDWIYLYDVNGNIVNSKKYGGTTRKQVTVTVPSNYVKILFRTDSGDDNYYGFHATVTANY